LWQEIKVELYSFHVISIPSLKMKTLLLNNEMKSLFGTMYVAEAQRLEGSFGISDNLFLSSRQLDVFLGELYVIKEKRHFSVDP
jgi:hypothetical protein